MMTQKYLGTNGFNRKGKKIIKKVIKAYKKFGLLSDLQKDKHGYRFLISNERMELLMNEIRLSFMEAGLI